MATKKSKIPAFRDEKAERKFWAEHSVEAFQDDLEDLDVEIRPARTEQIALRLYGEDLAMLRALAEKKGVGHTTLARSILEQWIGACREKLAVRRRRRPRKAS